MAEPSHALHRQLHATFDSLQGPNFRQYFAVQIASNIGNWVQITTENWLLLQLTPSSSRCKARTREPGMMICQTESLEWI